MLRPGCTLPAMSVAPKKALATVADLLAIQREERIRAEPFDGVSLSVRSLLEGDEDED